MTSRTLLVALEDAGMGHDVSIHMRERGRGGAVLAPGDRTPPSRLKRAPFRSRPSGSAIDHAAVLLDAETASPR